jgi:branched-chain amino acid aminotransferase
MAVLQMAAGSFPSREMIRDSITDLVVKNRIFSDARVRLTVFRKGAGLYTPDKMQVSWLIEATGIGQTGYSFPEKGLKIDVFKDFPKLYSPVSPFKTVASLPYVMAGIYCKEHHLDDCLVVNGQGKLIESFNSSLFWVKEDVVYTPLISSGCIDGVIRKKVLEVVGHLGLRLVESAGATEEDLQQADEVFLTNTIRGLRWVGAFRAKRYFARVSKSIFKHLLA